MPCPRDRSPVCLAIKHWWRCVVVTWQVCGPCGRLFTLLVVAPWFHLFTWVTLKLDYLLFPRFVKEEVRQPIFLISTGRSGTTFLHRLLNRGDDFVHFKFWELIAPSLTGRLLAGPLVRLLSRLRRTKTVIPKQTGHEVTIDAVEEDDLMLHHVWLSHFSWSWTLLGLDRQPLDDVVYGELPPKLAAWTMRVRAADVPAADVLSETQGGVRQGSAVRDAGGGAGRRVSRREVHLSLAVAARHARVAPVVGPQEVRGHARPEEAARGPLPAALRAEVRSRPPDVREDLLGARPRAARAVPHHSLRRSVQRFRADDGQDTGVCRRRVEHRNSMWRFASRPRSRRASAATTRCTRRRSSVSPASRLRGTSPLFSRSIRCRRTEAGRSAGGAGAGLYRAGR